MTGLEGSAVVLSLLAAATDTAWGRIPNALTLPGLAAALLVRVLAGAGSALDGLFGCCLVGGVPWVLHRLTSGKAIGGGDVKLFAALGALLGAAQGLRTELSAILVLGVFAVVRLAYDGRLIRVIVHATRLAVNPILPRRWRAKTDPEALTEMKFGPAIAVAVMTTLFADRLRMWLP